MSCGEEQNPESGLSWLRRAWDGVIERSQIQRLCQELITLRAAVAAEHPGLSGEQLYELVVMRLTHCNGAQAKECLNHVEESFAQWPVVREVTFRDVVLYFVLRKSLTFREPQSDTKPDFNTLVYTLVPGDL